jgi:hypothetical protein
MTGEGDKPIQGKREKTEEGDGKGMTGEERKNRN